MLQMNGYAVNAETPLELLTDYLTPNELFFVRSHWIPRTPDPKTWRLKIDGEVKNSIELSLADLRKLRVTEVTCVLQCAGNGRALYTPAPPGVQWKYGAVGNAKWRGVAVRDLLEHAGVSETAKHLHTFGSDVPPGKVPPFHRSVEMEKASDAIVAYEMNGEPLPVAHGAPLRLVVPGYAGDHWMKWLVRLSPQPEAQKGFYMDTAYRYPLTPGAPGVAFKPEEMRPLTDLAVKSNITTAPKKAKPGSTHEIRGFAFSGAPDVAKVEISDDDGKTWRDAQLDARHDTPYSWRLWSYRWTAPQKGRATLVARATDVRGNVQPRESVWNQSGYIYNGWHALEIEVAE